MKYTKIICIGVSKTGLSSIARALQKLGFTHIGYDEKLWQEYKSGNFQPILETAKQYETFTDAPWHAPDLHPVRGPDFYKILDEEFPNSKFILTIRDAITWKESHKNWWIQKRGKYIPPELTIYYPDGYSQTTATRLYRERNKSIIDYFRGRFNDLLIINICAGEGWDKLCQFLGKEIPSASFPHENKGKYIL